VKKKLKKAQVGTSVPTTSPEMRPNVANVNSYRDSIINEAYVNQNRQYAYELEKAKLRRNAEIAKNEAQSRQRILTQPLPPMVTPIRKKTK
jgi:hypothetical protein